MGEPVEERFPGLEPISFELKHNQPPKELNVTRVVILIFLRAIIKDDEELWRDRTAQMLC